jgi:hypothetical protein
MNWGSDLVLSVIFASPDWGAGATDHPIVVLCALICVLTPFIALIIVIALGIRDMYAWERDAEARRNDTAKAADDTSTFRSNQ